MTSFSFCRVVSENIHASTEGKGLGLANEEVPNPIRILFDLMAQTRMMSPILCSSPLFLVSTYLYGVCFVLKSAPRVKAVTLYLNLQYPCRPNHQTHNNLINMTFIVSGSHHFTPTALKKMSR